MDGLSALWLQLILLTCVLAVGVRLWVGRWWGIGTAAPFALIACLAGWGLMGGPADLLVWVSGIALLAMLVLPRLAIARLSRHVSLMNGAGAREEAARLSLFYWGRMGRYWRDVAEAMSLAAEGRVAEGDRLLAPYTMNAPRGLRQATRGYRRLLLVTARDWDAVLADLDAEPPGVDGRLSVHVASAVWRAHLERGELAEARACLERTELSSPRLTARTIDLLSLPFWALGGDAARLDQALARLKVPPYAAMSWQARCVAAQGRLLDAARVVEEAIAAVPDDQPAMVERLRQLEQELPQAHPLGTDPATPGELDRVEHLFNQPRRIAAVLTPTWPGVAVAALVVLIVLVLLLDTLHAWWPSDAAYAIATWLHQGELDPAAVKAGELWRLVTYQFLHWGVLHAGLNALALWWLGGMAAALYGPWMLLVIFFGSGILGGLAQAWLDPTSHAIGASGAVLGVFGAATAGLFRSGDLLPPALRKRLVLRMVAIALFQLGLDQLTPQIAAVIHAAGMASGALLGLVLPMRRVAP